MKKLLVIMVLGLLLSGNTYADTIYNGTFIDAHSQVGKLITDETVSKIINKNDVDLTLLSIRGKWKTFRDHSSWLWDFIGQLYLQLYLEGDKTMIGLA